MDPLQVALTLGSAFIGATSLLVASVALGARWEGRGESDGKLAQAKRYDLAVSQHPSVLEATALRAALDAYRAADTTVRKDLEAAAQTVSRAENEAAEREKRVQAHFETLGDAERAVDRLLRLNRPQGVRGALRSARRAAAPMLRRGGAPTSKRESGKGARA
ncbi:hypothetical protein PWG71_17375 [Nocardiopsis sp. N85]|uniref:hypothetical protein n=1 Tax=Nocardiopsis sp. N85 TaxID=3029400 RepID=UPI00237FB65F|nr:hypothetical protein [Nocardiopsis sp. N85]MDE3723166.1 hypothetical protein [Nocardiopsis sp. N85]